MALPSKVDDAPSLKFGYWSNKKLSNVCPFCSTKMKKIIPVLNQDSDWWYECRDCKKRIFPARKWEDANWYWLPL